MSATRSSANDGEAVTLVDGYVPVIDLGLSRGDRAGRRMETARAIGRACETSGFFVVVGHRVPAGTVTELCRAARDFFAQPAEVKQRVAVDPLDPLQRGYSARATLEMFTASRLREPLLGARQELDVPGLPGANRWPDDARFRDAYLNYYRAVEDLAGDLHRLLALALDLPEEWFDDKIDDHVTPMAINYYVPQDETGPRGDLRTQPHTDFGTVTLLHQEDAPGGLQVRDPDGQWVDVPAIPGSFVVNIGNLMKIWTNDRWASTVHRVVHPPEDQLHLDRISIPFFLQPNAGATISCIPTCTGPDNPPRYQPVGSGDYFVARSRRIFVERSMQERHGWPRPSSDVVTR